ncbi:SHOCT domain-containing protein [Clostridium sp. Marseille-Q2269]|uniref:SHOCT domain-containing protein n=1 Tax=Clostridium sp. Marseille-Q2269 TaxID=2942205 RepID=UPI002073DA16|nr:SHOCT domain-containing protein [Clostridium sp. Marseille-Q2269]
MFGCGFGGSGAAFTGGWSAWMIIPMIFRLAVISGIIYVAWKLVRGNMLSSNNAFKILNEKYAMGEISEEEYLKRKSTMGK